jgi:hypothetical protein
MENLNALLAILYSSNLLLSAQGVQQPCEDPSSWTLPQITELKEFFSPMPICTSTQCPPGRVSSHRTSSSFVPSCAPYAPAQCPLGRALRILSDSDFCLNSQQSSSSALCACAQCPPGRASQNSQQSFCLLCTPCTCSMPSWQSSTELKERFCLQLCSSPQPCLLRYLATSKVFF